MNHPSMNDMWLHIISELTCNDTTPSRNGPALVHIGYAESLGNVDRNFLTVEARALKPYYANAELLWYLSGRKSIAMIQSYAPSYAKYDQGDGTTFGAYGDRWINDYSFRHHLAYINSPPKSQLFAAIEVLRRFPESRQCIMSMWNGGDLCHAIVADKADLPCTLGLQFMIHHKQLHCISTMRSNDAWLGFPYDVFCFTSIQRLIAYELGIYCGHFYHRVGNMHLYEKNYKAVASIKHDPRAIVDHVYPDYICSHLDLDITLALEYEALSRSGMHLTEKQIREIRNPILRDAVICCASKWQDGYVHLLTSEVYRSMIL